MTAPLFLTLPFKLERDPPPFEGNDIKYPEALVRHFLKTYTKNGDKVFDPFTGLGTTLFVAEEMGRIPYGIEADPEKYEWVAGQLENWSHLQCDDSAQMNKIGFPKMDFAMMSPPFMPNHHQWNPLYSGNPKYAGYAAYLKRLAKIFSELNMVMKKGAHIVVQVDNLPGRSYTPLVRDMSIAIERSFRLDAEIIVAWENPTPSYTHTHCLVAKKV